MENQLRDFIPITIPPSPDQPQEHHQSKKKKKIKWADLISMAKNWAKEPINMALLLWLLSVSLSLFILFLLMTGLLNSYLPHQTKRKIMIENFNQITNALFSLICLYQHPTLIHHLSLLLRWTQKDEETLWEVYSKNRRRDLDRRIHLGVVVVNLNVTCCVQYVLCGLFWGYDGTNRPEVIVNVFIVVGVVCPVWAAVYAFFGPLRNDGEERVCHEHEHGHEFSRTNRESPLSSATTKESSRSVQIENEHEHVENVTNTNTNRNLRCAGTSSLRERDWAGGVFEICQDKKIAFMSFFCFIWVFGRNMEKLGFGNRFVHGAKFTLVFVGPVSVFYAAAVRIEDGLLREMMVVLGFCLSCLGFVYGGYWRTMMRRKMKLKKSFFCFGIPNFGDCFLWVFCWACSLAQEVRTVDFYGVEEGSVEEKKEEEGNDDGRVHPLSIGYGDSGAHSFPPLPLNMSAQN